ncbi:nicotinate-nucleotide adenylyltransferase [Virgibacillus sp. W0430]|uniref:nicotinate-nucleotide adenylyltransferase n=1 Tax=Virgibacillus sp. W0430 TaxID=3391580 RepID=UPI003F48D24F
MKKIGIFGGTFDPPHLGHLIMAEEVKNALNLEEVWFIPTNEPPHKEKAMTRAADRLNMLRKAIAGNAFFKINTVEIDRSGVSYTVDTIRTLKKEYPTYAFYFIIGADMVEYLPKWKQIEELVQLVTFVGVRRSGYQIKTDYPLIEVDVPLVTISSSFIRARLTKNKSVTYLIPSSVHTYIKERQLYEKV